MENRSRKHGWPFWFAIVLIVMPVLYVLCFGPACWITMRLKLAGTVINVGYRPIVRSMDRVPRQVRDFALWYSKVGGDEDIVWFCDMAECDWEFRDFARLGP